MYNIKEELSLPARLEMIAEEASELSQAALKLSRYLRDENPVCRSKEELEKNLTEEISDVSLAIAATDYRPDWGIIARKKERWQDRIQRQKEQVVDD